MSIYTPYFYIIQDTRNGMYYAGAKWGRDANPETFMTKGGYTTSSVVVNSIIKQYGIEVFSVKRLRYFQTVNETYDYETRFLKRVNAKDNPLFYNQHNNDHLFTFHDARYQQKMQDVYGVSHPLHSDEIRHKLNQTNLARYGAPNVFNRDSSIRESVNHTIVERYGVENISQLAETQEKIKQTSMDKRNVDHHLKDPCVIQKRLETLSVRDVEETRDVYVKVKSTKQQRYGDSKYNNIQQIRQTNCERYGVENVSKLQEVQLKMSIGISQTKNSDEWKNTKGVVAKHRLSATLNSEEWKNTKGKEKSEKIREANKHREKKPCQHCGKLVSTTNYIRWHGDKCKSLHTRD